MARRKPNLFLLQGSTFTTKKNMGYWWLQDRAVKEETLKKKMKDYLDNWDGNKRFAIVKSKSGVHAKRRMNEVEMKIRQRKLAKKFNDGSWGRYGRKQKEDSYYGKILKLVEKNK